MTAGFYNKDNIAFSNPRELRVAWLWYRLEFDWTLKDTASPTLTFVRKSSVQVRPVPLSYGVTDFASIPPFFWCIPGFSPTRFPLAALLHDAVYHTGQLSISTDGGATWTVTDVEREYADELLAEMIEYELVPGNKIEQCLYLDAVRIGGGRNWKKAG